MKSGFKGTINLNQYDAKVTVQQEDQYLGFSIDPRFQGINRLFVLSFEKMVVEQVTRDIIFH